MGMCQKKYNIGICEKVYDEIMTDESCDDCYGHYRGINYKCEKYKNGQDRYNTCTIL
jgi:hypothetical protein